LFSVVSSPPYKKRFPGALGVASKVGKVSELANIGSKLSKAGSVLDPISGTLRAGSSVLSKASKTGEKVAAGLYSSALKPSTTLPKTYLGRYPQVVQTGLKNAITVGKDGLETVADNIFSIDNEVSALIQKSGKTGAKVDSMEVVKALDDTVAFYKDTIGGSKYIDELDALRKEFLMENGKSIPIERAQLLKQRTGTLLRKMYGELKSVEVEGRKALVRGLKEQVAKIVPEVGELNAKEALLIDLEKSLDRALGRIQNHQLIGLKDAVIGAGGVAATKSPSGFLWGLATKLIDSPEIKSRIANIIYKF